MKKTITLSEENLVSLIEKLVEQEMGDEFIVDNEMDVVDVDGREDIEDTFDAQEILTPEQIIGLMEEQIVQLQDRTQYSEELLADVLEFQEYLMADLEMSKELNMRKSKQKLRALQTRAGREIFWLKSRRL